MPSAVGLPLFDADWSVDYTDRNRVEQWYHTLKMRVDRFHNSWIGSRLSVRQWLAAVIHYYNFHRPHRALNERTPTQEDNYGSA